MNTDLVKRIASAPNREYLEKIELVFNFNRINYPLKLKGVYSINEFIQNELSFWSKVDKDFNNPRIKNILNFYTYVNSDFNNFLNVIQIDNLENIKIHFRQFQQRAAEHINQYDALPKNTPQTEFLINILNSDSSIFEGAYCFTMNKLGEVSLQNINILKGVLKAYEFSEKDNTGLAERIKHERKSISTIRADFQKKLDDANNTLIEHFRKADKVFDDYHDEFGKLHDTQASKFNEWFSTTSEKTWKEWFETTKDFTWNNFFDSCKINIAALEDTYENKLMLEKPARYWRKKSISFYRHAEKARETLNWVIICSSLFLALILIISPKWIFENVFSGNTVAIVRWSLVFITLLTLIAYVVRALNKYMFSSYHLARDAEERHTLTFFYLSLMKNSNVSDDDRRLILQSLFSRTDTGLLKEDSGPTMPTDSIKGFVNPIKNN